MEKINLENYICHGLSGMRRELDDMSDLEVNKIRDAIQAELEGYDPYWDKDRKMITGNGIIKKFIDIRYCNPSILFGLYRLLQILKRKKIETFEDIQKRQDELVINGGKSLGTFNNSKDICFSKRDANFYPNASISMTFSCDTGRSYGCFIEDGISLILPYDDKFRSYEKSDDLEGVFKDELRIRGSISEPNISAIGLPLTERIKNITKPGKRPYCLKNYKGIITFIREMLNKFGYSEVYVVDSSEGYNLENRDIIRAYELAIEKGEMDTYLDRDYDGSYTTLLRSPDSFVKCLSEFAEKDLER